MRAPFSTETISIQSSGTLNYWVQNYAENTEASEGYVLSRNVFDLIVANVEESGFYDLESSYSDDSIQDATAYTISVMRGGEETSVYCYATCPQEMIDLRERIVSVWGGQLLNIEV